MHLFTQVFTGLLSQKKSDILSDWRNRENLTSNGPNTTRDLKSKPVSIPFFLSLVSIPLYFPPGHGLPPLARDVYLSEVTLSLTGRMFTLGSQVTDSSVLPSSVTTSKLINALLISSGRWIYSV